MNRIEILSPAGGYESVYAAVRAGADAIYVGAKDFSARASAHNFTLEELSSAVKYCHRFGVKVYLALNTVIFDDEMNDALELVKNAAKSDIDALITQDIGLAQAVRKIVPDLKLHASTQMSVHTLSGAKALKELGFSRVVLAREMTKSEIKYIADNCDIELEVFVHGALCMCVSGQCYMSAMLGTRSANRGMCAQPCRLPFATANSTHALSLKDNSLVDYIKELEEIGVVSAKIEGRMKRPEYVAMATSACRQMRDNGFVDSVTNERLQAVFSRTGFTDGYYTDNRGSEMFGFRKRDDVVKATEKLFREIRTTYKDEFGRIAIDVDMKIALGEKMILTVSDGRKSLSVESENAVEKAMNAPATEEKIAQLLNKTGDTPFVIKNVNVDINGDCFVAAKDVNLMRRTAFENLALNSEIWHNYEISDFSFDDLLDEIEEVSFDKKPSYAITRDLNIPESFSSCEYVFVPLFECEKHLDKVKGFKEKGINIALDIPRGMFSREEKIAHALDKLKSEGITHAMCHNIGAFYLCKERGFDVHLSCFMNIANSLSINWAKNYGASDVELSFELDLNRINALKVSLPSGVASYGYLPLMMTRNCPLKSGGANCATCKTANKLQDRKGEEFTVVCDTNVSEILNCVPLILPLEIYKSKNVVFKVFHFSVENSVENKEKILKNISEKRSFERFTHGLYIRGVKNFTIF
ncbi:MAG: U32 family peptidase [Ruminococcus sp.]|nr:U32 family peptidase [Ruminococcus sp.]